MKRMLGMMFLMALCCAFVGCGGGEDKPSPPKTGEKEVKSAGTDLSPAAGEQRKAATFKLATSEYPSWSTFMVAGKANLINPAQGGELGALEKKYNIDLVLEVKDYDPCLTLYGESSVDAVCMTNIDALNPSLRRASTAICPTSTSVGGDKVIAIGASSAADLKGTAVHGLDNSVSEYVFVRGLEKQGLNPGDYEFKNLDPAPAATALQTGSQEIRAICVWNPFALQTLRSNKESKEVFSSSVIPEEVIDMVVVANESLEKPGGEDFACLLCEAFYTVNSRLEDKTTGDAVLAALGEDFSNLSVEDMRIVIKDTKFYMTAQDGIRLFASSEFPKTMETVVSTCQKIGILMDKSPTIGFNDNSKQLNFSTKYMEKVATTK